MVPNVEDDAGAVWVTSAELAKRRGVSRQAIGKRLDQLEAEGRVVTRREGRSRLVDLASFDRAVGDTGDAVKEQAAETVRETSAKASPAMRDAQTERAQYEARIKALDLADRRKQVLPIAGEHGIEAAATRIGLALARDLDAMVRHADDIAAAVGKEGAAGARRILKEIATRARQTVAASLAEIAAEGAAAEKQGLIETLLPDE